MTKKLPPIQLLSAFDSTVRHLSIKNAAMELHLTPSAISQQIKTLELALGHKLFRRETRAIFLTDAGSAYHEVAQRTLAQYRDGQRRFDQRFNRSSLRISVLPFMAHELLIPRLNLFHEHNEGGELRIETGMSFSNFNVEDIDAAVRIGKGEWNGLYSRKLCDLTATMVCSPDYLSKHKPTLGNLQTKTLLHRLDTADWDQAAKLLGLQELSANRNLVFDSDLAALIAATKGIGIAIGLRPFIDPLINDGRLCTPFSHEHQTSEACYFVVREGDQENSKLTVLYDWLKGLVHDL